MAAYYNEIDHYAAQWLRNLIGAGLITPGEVDERSIVDVRPADLAGFAQCHFFAGISVWSYALRLAGWPDDRPVWTGSCPCQPFSAAGRGEGFADERHLWPAWADLIRERRPAVCFGEQVASAAAGPWIDLVHADLEAMDYAFGCVPFPAAGVGAPNIRDRAFWVADTQHGGRQTRQQVCPRPETTMPHRTACRVADSSGEGLPTRERLAVLREGRWGEGRAAEQRGGASACGLANADGGNTGTEGLQRGGEHGQQPKDGRARGGQPGPTNGFWRDPDWLFCRDGRWRPVEPGTFPLAHGAPARVGRLRAYGNAINAEAAAEFIRAYLDVREAA